MKKILLIITSIVLLLSCTIWFELTNVSVKESYKISDRSINLSNNKITGFVNMNTYMSGIEVNNIYLSNNQIQLIDVSWFEKLWKLEINNNKIRFLSDLKLPIKIRHLNISWNQIDSIIWIEKYKKLKTLDISFNNLDIKDLDLTLFKNLQYINIEWNSFDLDFINKVNDFNALYLSKNKKPYSISE